MSKSKIKSPCTQEELVETLRWMLRDSGLTQKEFAAKIGISFQLLSQILIGNRSVVNPQMLRFLAPRGKRWEQRDMFYLITDSR